MTELHPETGRDIWVLDLEGESVPFLVTPSDEGAAKFSSDGVRFLMVRTTDASSPSQIKVVLNCFDELQRLVPSN